MTAPPCAVVLRAGQRVGRRQIAVQHAQRAPRAQPQRPAAPGLAAARPEPTQTIAARQCTAAARAAGHLIEADLSALELARQALRAEAFVRRHDVRLSVCHRALPLCSCCLPGLHVMNQLSRRRPARVVYGAWRTGEARAQRRQPAGRIGPVCMAAKRAPSAGSVRPLGEPRVFYSPRWANLG